MAERPRRSFLAISSVISLLFGLCLWSGEKSLDQAITPVVSANDVATSASVASPTYKTVAIREIQPAGYKVLADNPQTPGRARGDFGEFDPRTWQVHRFLMTKPDGGWLKIGLARPTTWIESAQRDDDGQVWLEFEELGIADWATLQAIESCPNNILGEGRLVTGTFEHSSGEVLNLFIAGESEPIGSTSNHPFWSEDRQDFVQAGSLNPGEHLRLADGRTTTLERTEPLAEELPVYNLEVDGEHVYFVGESGVLVHNAGKAYPALRPEKGYLGGKKHGIDWSEGKALATRPDKLGQLTPQGQWGSKADLNCAGRQAATLKPGEARFFDLPEGHTSIVWGTDGVSRPALRAWLRNNGTGTFHGYPLE